MSKYPYVQKQTVLHNEKCERCSKIKEKVTHTEWRVDWFQGNCEYETLCDECTIMKIKEEKERREIYKLKMAPIWKKQNEKRKERERKHNLKVEKAKEIIGSYGLEIKNHANGQWTIGGVIDWWTSTGSAFNRKTKDRFILSFDKLEELEQHISKINN